MDYWVLKTINEIFILKYVMILIPDVHIGTKQGDKILRALESIFQTHDDQDVLFLGDYVYMFSYDRSYLLKLFDLFVSLYQQGRRVLVMA